MSKAISCGDIMPGCAFKANAPNEAELLQQVAQHAAEAHGITEVTPEILGKVRAAIREA